MKIKYLETFYSGQGEGLFCSLTPSVFLRTAGCNFRCLGFGMPKGQLAPYEDYSAYKSLEEIPIPQFGCDTQPSHNSSAKHLWLTDNPKDLAQKLTDLIPNKAWVNDYGQDIHLVISGGEPLLGWQKAYIDLLKALPDIKNITFETNGTQLLNNDLVKFIENETNIIVTFSISAKLSASGEKFEDAIRPEAVATYFLMNEHRYNSYFKFVVETEEDVDEVKIALDVYKAAGITLPVYLMAVGGKYEEYQKNVVTVANLALKNGFRYSPRLHVDIFRNNWAT